MINIKDETEQYTIQQLNIAIKSLQRQLNQEGCLAGQYGSYDLSTVGVGCAYWLGHMPGVIVSLVCLLGIGCHEYMTKNVLLHREIAVLNALKKNIISTPSIPDHFQATLFRFTPMFSSPLSNVDRIIGLINTTLDSQDIKQSGAILRNVVRHLERKHNCSRSPLTYIRPYNPISENTSYVLK
jgi:hypothetical protein